MKLCSGVIESILVPGGQEAATKLYNLFINVHHDSLFYRLVCQDFPQGGALASTGNEHSLRLGMRQHSWVYQGFVVDKLIRLAGLNLAIQDETNAEAARIDNIYGLKLTSP
jgi:hypothetical protein